MTSTLLDLSGKIDSLTVSALRQVERIALREHVAFFIVGATARDILLGAAHGIARHRATVDIDLAVFLKDWVQFDRVKKLLIQSTGFEPGREIQQLIFKGQLPVDIVPFGEIAGTADRIEWPPDKSIRMSVAGFRECHRNSIPIRMAEKPELVVQVVSLAGLAILKLVSWDDNPERRLRDAVDLCIIIQNYLDAGNLDRLFDDAPNIVEAEENDFELASARLLGRDMADITSEATKSRLLQILGRESARDRGHRIAMDVLQSRGFGRLEYERVLIYFEYLLKGLTDTNR